MSTLRSALDELRAEDLASAPERVLVSDVDELERAIRIVEAERARRLCELDRRRVFAADGHLSTAAWLAHRQGLSRRAAEGAVRRAQALEEMSEVARAFAQGEVSTSAVDELARAREQAPEAFAKSEPALVEASRTMPFGELRRVLETWKAAADPDGAAEEEDRRYERRNLNVGPSPDGMVRIDGELDPETGQSLITAIRAVIDVEARGTGRSDGRTPTQRRADALGEVSRGWLRSLERPTIGNEVPHVVVTMDVDTLRGRPGSPGRSGRSGRGAELSDTGRITPETARRIACDANVTRVITGARSEPLELGRRTRVVPAALRRALGVRDRGCRFPGCGRPPGWADAHHVVHWADGGETSISNLVLLCRPHHRVVHRGFGVAMVEGRPVFTRPDGTEIEDRAPP